MPSIQIPESSYAPLRLFIDITNAQFDELMKSISECPPKLSEKAFIENVASRVRQTTKLQVQTLIREIYSLINLQEELEASSQEVSQLIADASVDVGNNDFSVTTPELEILKARLQAALDAATTIRLIAKAMDVTVDHDRAFLKARVFTDIRPIFNKDATELAAASVVHMLTIHYYRNSKHKDFYVALDDNDIESMIQTLRRAQQKSIVLRNVTQKADIAYIAP